MKQTTPKQGYAHSVASLLNTPDGTLKALLERLAMLEEADLTLQSILPASLRGQCRGGLVVGERLQVECLSAGALTKLRFLEAEIVAACQAQGWLQVKGLELKVRG